MNIQRPIWATRPRTIGGRGVREVILIIVLLAMGAAIAAEIGWGAGARWGLKSGFGSGVRYMIANSACRPV